MRVAAIIAAGGRGERLGAGVPKQLLPVGGVSILARSVAIFAGHDLVDEIVVVLPPELAVDPPAGLRAGAKPVRVVEGGARRQDSVRRGFDAVRDRADLVVVHDAARPFASRQLVTRVIGAAREAGAALAALAASDTVKLAAGDAGPGAAFVERTLPRQRIHLAQTPQAFQTRVLAAALEAAGGVDATDEAALVEAVGFPVQLVEGEASNMKITTITDLATADAVAGGSGARVGTGYDLHRLVEGRPLVLGGVTIPFDRGLAGHSDADVAAHAVTDAVLGAVAGGDIGRHFPDTDARWKDASSLAMLAHAAGAARSAGFEVVNVDVVIVAERPKIAPFADAIRAGLAGALGIGVERVSVKGKTNEGLDAVGRGEAMAAHAVALVASRH